VTAALVGDARTARWSHQVQLVYATGRRSACSNEASMTAARNGHRDGAIGHLETTRARSTGRSDGFQACAAGQADRPSGRIMSEDAHARPAGDAPEPLGRLAGRRTGSPRSIGRLWVQFSEIRASQRSIKPVPLRRRIQLRCSNLPTRLESAFDRLRTERIFADTARAEWRFDYSLHLAPQSARPQGSGHGCVR
jgi:hypothetical protein